MAPGASVRPFAVIVLAAGGGTRMKSSRPKVLHEVAGWSLLGHVLAAVRPLAAEHTVVVIGHGREQVAEHLAAVAPDVLTTVQAEQRGTGHAVRVTLEQLAERGIVPGPEAGPVLVLTGDTPLLTEATLEALVARFAADAGAVTILTAVLAEPGGYGRIVRGPDGDVTGIVEHKDADETVLAIDEVNSGMYAFAPGVLEETLHRLTTANAQGEEYLTDVVAIARADGLRVTGLPVADVREILGVNDRVQLAAAGRILRDRINEHWLRAGVTMADPERVRIDAGVELAPDVTLEPDVALHGSTRVATGATIGPGTELFDTVVEAGAHVRRTEAHGAHIGPHASVGPFTYLRPGTRLGAHGKIGGFCEVKNADIGERSKVPHLSYVGDAQIGTGTNIGAATVFVNYDGVAKHRTTIGDEVRIGSDTMLVAPVVVGDGAYTAAGSVITQDVPAGALGIGRGRQRNLPGWVRERRPGSSSAEAAGAAQDS
jgi:bifunctional UDP-N-acetylglucosamine pyrophosphorylase/glucosamine-1-phosphate N-acetyltransferase